MLDTAYAIETPEGVTLEISPAGPVVRFLAWVIDFLLRSLIYIGLASVLGYLGEFGTGLMLVGLFLIEWFYPVLFEVYRGGQTPGKRAMGIKVVQDTGVPVGWSPSVIRNLLRAVDFLPLAYGFGVLSMLMTKDFRRLGDLAAGTLVVYAHRSRAAVDMPAVEPRAPPSALRLEEQRAIIDFAERAPTLSEARAGELAAIAWGLTGVPERSAVARLYEIAVWLQGRG